MEEQELKERIISDDNIILILEELGMHSIKDFGTYISCGVPDGDRKNSTIIYKNTLKVEAYTRNIVDAYGRSDIISLVSYINGTHHSQSIYWICQVCGYDYYGNNKKTSQLACWTRTMYQVKNHEIDITEEQLKPLNESILKYYGRYVNDLFYNDDIPYWVQDEFELGYDTELNMITIPIRDDIGKLVGVKGRLFKEEINDNESKYLYLHKCPKNKILFGLHKTWKYILEKREVIIVEAEKSVMQLWGRGIRNAVAIGGHKLSKYQVKKLTYLNVPIVIAYDQGVEIGRDGKIDKTFYPSEFDKFMKHQEIYCIYDRWKNILNERESPTDNAEKWEFLYNNKIKVRG